MAFGLRTPGADDQLVGGALEKKLSNVSEKEALDYEQNFDTHIQELIDKESHADGESE